MDSLTKNSEGKLFYSHCRTEVKLGDSITYKPLLRREMAGVVVYMPGVSPVHRSLEQEAFRQWAVQLENGRILAWFYNPAELQPSPRIRFVRRAGEGFQGIQPEDEFL